jgi:hypothetical protein
MDVNWITEINLFYSILFFSRLYMEEEETCRLHCEKPFDMGW